MTLSFFVPGIPRPGGSKKAIWRPGMRHASVVDAGGEHTKNWRGVVALSARAAHRGPPLEGPLLVKVTFYMPRPKGHFGKRGLKPKAPPHHVFKPDATKLWRSTEDAMSSIVWRDDSQIIHQYIHKEYTSEKCGAHIEVIELSIAGTLI
jgi:Holliday junction resolvase RusA-like endonuclease